MADRQRRYTPEQVKRVQESGEAAPMLNTAWNLFDRVIGAAVATGPALMRRYATGEDQVAQDVGAVSHGIARTQANARAAIPRSFTDMYALTGVIGPAVRAGLSSDLDFDEAMFGEDGLKSITNHVQDRISDYMDRLPDDQRTEENVQKLTQAVMNSPETKEFILDLAPAAFRQGSRASNAINESVGLRRADEETTIDEATQIAAAAAVPLPGGVGARVARRFIGDAVESTVGKIGLGAAELLLPGTAPMTAGRVAANAGVGAGIAQGMRAITDQPSVFTGDALAADNGVDLLYDDDAEEEAAALTNEEVLQGGSALSGMVALGAALFGKANKVVRGAVADADVAVKDAIKEGGTPNAAADEFGPVLTTGNKVTARVADRNAPFRDVTKKATENSDPITRANAIDDMDYAASEANSANQQTRLNNLLDSGHLDGMETPTVPLRQLYRMREEMTPDEWSLFDNAAKSSSLLERRNLNRKNLQQRVAELENEAHFVRHDPERYSQTRARLQASRKRLRDLENDVEGGRIELQDISTADAKRYVFEAQNNPKLAYMMQQVKKINTDILNHAVKQGLIGAEDAKRMTNSHSLYMPFIQDPYAGKTGNARFYAEFKDKYLNDKKAAREGVRTPFMFRQADVDAERIQNSKDLLNPLDAQAAYLQHYVREYTSNRAIATFVRGIKGTEMDGRAIKHLNEPMSIKLAQEKNLFNKYSGRDDIVSYMDNGNINFIQVADPDLAKAMHFAAPAVARGWNGARKLWQQGTTGVFNPVFSFKSAEYEYQIARYARRPGRSFGYIDKTIRAALPNSTAIGRILDNTNLDPTFRIQQLAAIFNQVSGRAIRDLGRKIGEDLSMQSGLFNSLAKTPGGKDFLSGLGRIMVKQHNDSTFGVFSNSGIANIAFTEDATNALRADYSDLASKFSLGTDYANNLKNAGLHSYRIMLESVHNSAKYAFFAQNYAVLRKKFNGKVPQKELDRLVYETKTLSGDMSATAGSDAVSKLYSATPYTQIAATSMRFMGQTVRDYPVQVFGRLLTGLVLPTALGIAYMSSDDETWDWYWNKLAPWQRMSTSPIIKPQWWADYLSGNERPLKPDDVHLVTLAPEVIAPVGVVMSGLRALGVFGKQSQDEGSFRREAVEALGSLVGVAMPPILSFGAALGGNKFNPIENAMGMLGGGGEQSQLYQDKSYQGGNPGGLNRDSYFSQYFNDAVVSLFGNAWGMYISMFDTAQQTYEDTGSFSQAVGQAFDFLSYDNEMRMIENPVTATVVSGMWSKGERRTYSGTTESQMVRRIQEMYEPLGQQRSMERNDDRIDMIEEDGSQAAKMIQDPELKHLAETIHSSLKQGDMRKLDEQLRDLRARNAANEASKDTKSPREYHELRNDIATRMQILTGQQARIIRDLDKEIREEYNGSLEQAIQVIQQNIGR